jgi:hypothetical protein
MFGPRYVLRDFDNDVEIALGGKGGSGNEVDLESCVSFLFDGGNYTQIRDLTVSVVGHIRYVGPVVDAPPFSLEVEKVIDQKKSQSQLSRKDLFLSTWRAFSKTLNALHVQEGSSD